MKAVAATLGVARSNLVEQLRRLRRPQHGPYRRAEDGAVLSEIRAITDDSLEIPCWNSEVTRIVEAVVTHDRKLIARVATYGSGISGEMIGEMMLDCVERRFSALRAPHPVQWLADKVPPIPPSKPPPSP